ncbi:hypothetical protein BOTBODRAFT_72433, partial [Botryobasidium botryosum FD-172 SS1]
IKKFISEVLAYDPDHKDLKGGILGVCKGYYGCVECQGRGTLHQHMLVWVHGALSPNKMKERISKLKDENFCEQLKAFLDDTISTHVPPLPEQLEQDTLVPSSKHHPCSVRGPSLGLPTEEYERARQADLHHLVKKCQTHTHKETCWKHCKVDEVKTCRFGLDPSNTTPETIIDMETGEITLQHLEGMINNYCEVILEAVRCNVDIKPVLSGAVAKALSFYFTDYITKSTLKSHIAYQALETAVKKMGELDLKLEDKIVHVKRLLQKCANAMISQQELAGAEVASHLLGLEDHFTSHTFNNLYWTSFEHAIEKQDPSPECSAKS